MGKDPYSRDERNRLKAPGAVVERQCGIKFGFGDRAMYSTCTVRVQFMYSTVPDGCGWARRHRSFNARIGSICGFQIAGLES